MIHPVKHQRLYEIVCDRLQSLIASGELSAGDQLPNERALAEQFDVSRTVIREAFKALAVRGLIEVRPGQGTFVVDGTGDMLSQSFQTMVNLDQGADSHSNLVEVREILEPEIAYLAALRAKPENLAAMRQAVADMYERMDDLNGFIEADDAFHLALAMATQNSLIPRLMASVVDVLQKNRGRIFRTEGGPQRGQWHHERILRSVEERAPEAAREAMKGHLAQVRNDSTGGGADDGNRGDGHA